MKIDASLEKCHSDTCALLITWWYGYQGSFRVPMPSKSRRLSRCCWRGSVMGSSTEIVFKLKRLIMRTGELYIYVKIQILYWVFSSYKITLQLASQERYLSIYTLTLSEAGNHIRISAPININTKLIKPVTNYIEFEPQNTNIFLNNHKQAHQC